MDENKSPQDILNEIFQRTEKPIPASPERPAPDEPFPVLPPGGPKERGAAERLLPWLCLVLGAALLVMGVCLFQLVRVNHRLNELQQAVEAVQTVDSLRQENKLLQSQLEQQAAQNEWLTQALDDDAAQLTIARFQKMRANYLWYIGQFMDSGNYPMAVLAAMLDADTYFPDYYTVNSQPVFLDPTQTTQYQAYRQELVKKGYLEETSSPSHDYYVSSQMSVKLNFAEQWDPGQNPDMAALGILWCAMSQYYVVENSGAAAQFLVRYQDVPLGDDGTPFPQRLRDSGSDEIVWQYELLVNALIANGELVTTGDGTLDYSPGLASDDVLYGLPFDPPINTALIKIPR